MPGCSNYINILDASPLLNNIANGCYPPPVEYNLMENIRNIPYWLADVVGEWVSTGVGKRDDPEGDTVEVARLGW